MAAPRDIVFSLEPGARIQVEVKGLDLKLHSYHVGTVKGRYIMIQLPILADKNKDGLFTHLYQDNLVTIRYLQLGEVKGILCKVIRYIMSPFPLLFLSYPVKVQTHSLRKHKRVPCLIHAKAHIGSNAHRTIITDLSLGGCQTLLKRSGEGDITLNIDDVMNLECAVFGATTEERLECKVMRLNNSNNRLQVGVRFVSTKEHVLADIDRYINDALEFLE